MTYISTKTYGHDIGLSACFRQWKADSHCRFMHGYALAIRVEFEAEELDEKNFVVDFGGLKTFKKVLEDTFDHKTLVAEDDPRYTMFKGLHDLGVIEMVEVEATGCEAFAKMVYDYAEIWLTHNDYSPRVIVRSVEVREHGANSAIYTGEG
jgi:6-pyruvoyltetrahydropterin/6-carboxytetrahydropterin synthase